MKNGVEIFEDPAKKASGNLAEALDILADSRKRREKLRIEQGRLDYLESEYKLAKKRGDEEGARRMSELEIAIDAVKESIEKLSKPTSISSGSDASQS